MFGRGLDGDYRLCWSGKLLMKDAALALRRFRTFWSGMFLGVGGAISIQTFVFDYPAPEWLPIFAGAGILLVVWLARFWVRYGRDTALAALSLRDERSVLPGCPQKTPKG